VNEPGPVTTGEWRAARPVFISYATADRKQALAICEAMERLGTQCWISTRDVPPGDNYQEAIVRSLRDARAMVLVFSEAANNSDEIKKELSLASRFHIPVMALRIEDVEPSDAFAYELSTRQWIDAFDSWERSIDSLVRQIGKGSAPSAAAAPGERGRATRGLSRNAMVAAAAVLILGLAAGTWWFLRPGPAAEHSMMVRLVGFTRLSNDLPEGTPGAIGDEIIAAFNNDGVVGVSTASAAPAGNAPAYALGGTVRRDGEKIKVNVRLSNERTGATLWTNIYSYDVGELARVPRHIGVDAGNMVRCGLFAASTYPKPLADPVLTDYLQYCHNSGFVEYEPGKALVSATKVVGAAPDFSWGWSAVADGAWGLVYLNPRGPRAAEYRKQALDAANKAIALDNSNSEALDMKGILQPPNALLAREALFKRALDARPLACGCEHHIYGLFLQVVGRTREAADEFRRSTEVLSLNPDSQLSLAATLLLEGKADEAKQHIDATLDLTSEPAAADQVTVLMAAITGDNAGALKAIRNPKFPGPEPFKKAVEAGFQAMVANDPAAKARAAQALIALPPEMRGGSIVPTLVGALGANRAALEMVADERARGRFDALALLFMPAMRGALDDPAFPAYAERLGLMRYWKASHSQPDICSTSSAPAFCRMI
jgi:tetratricopeptide (TPR) repeat protein